MARSSSSGLFPKEALFTVHPGLHLTHQCNAIYESSTIIRYLSHCVFIQTRIQYILSIIRPWFLKVGKLFIVTVIIIIIIIMTIMIIIIMINRLWFLQVGNLQAVLLLVSSLRMSVPVPGLTRNLTILPLWGTFFKPSLANTCKNIFFSGYHGQLHFARQDRHESTNNKL